MLPPPFMIDAWKKQEELRQQQKQDESRRIPAPPPPTAYDYPEPQQKPRRHDDPHYDV